METRVGVIAARLDEPLHILTYHAGTLFQKLAVLRLKGIRRMTVDVNLSHNEAAYPNGCNDLRLGVHRARKIPRIRRNILHNYCLTQYDSRTTDSPRHRNPHMRRGFPVKRAKYEHRCIFRVQHIEADPIVAGDLFRNYVNNSLLQPNNARRTVRKSLDFSKKAT